MQAYFSFYSYFIKLSFPVHFLFKWRQNLSARINAARVAQSVQQLATGWTVRDRIPVEARFYTPVQTGPGAHPASFTMGTGSFPGAKSGRGVTLTPQTLLVPWSRKNKAIPLLTLWAVRSVQSLSACTRVHFTIYLTFTYIYIYTYIQPYGYFIDRTISGGIEISQSFFPMTIQFFAKPDNFLMSIYSEFDVFIGCCHRHERQKEFSQSMTYFIK